MATPIVDGSLASIAVALRARRLSATELMEAALARHSEYGAKLHAYKYLDAEGALAGARSADARLAGGDAPPLCGIPVSVKDLYGVDGMPTFAGSARRLPEKPWSYDAWLIERLRQAGAVIVGKTHTVEFAYGGVGMNPHWGTPWNPWDAEVARIPGGSSCGAAVSLWEGSALLALGSDTGGSIRIPAGFTGVVGHKTTKGRWPTDGVVQLSSTFDTVGALTRTVEDSIHFFGSVDPQWGNPAPLFESLAATSVDGLRIAAPRCGIWADCQSDIAEVLDAALVELESAGAERLEVDGRLLDDAYEVYMTGGIGKAECHAFLSEELPEWLELLHPTVGRRLENPAPMDSPAYRRVRAKQRRMAAFAAQLFADADVLALPTNLITAPPVAEVTDDLARYVEVNRATLRPTCPANFLGLCAISIPVGLDGAGMPVGLQLVGRGHDDEALLGAALAVERALGTGPDRMGQPPLPGIRPGTGERA
jgi:aspartyl-tRNA(Asn)/glutamyl-tRNA(Gln) amidotransferase subunit A